MPGLGLGHSHALEGSRFGGAAAAALDPAAFDLAYSLRGVVDAPETNIGRLARSGDSYEIPISPDAIAGDVSYTSENLLLQSEDFATTWSGSAHAVTANDANSPFGALLADKVADNNDAGPASAVYAFQAITLPEAGKYYLSGWAKADGLSWLQVSIAQFGIGAGAYRYYDLTAGAPALGTDGGVLSDMSIEEYRNGWMFIKCAFTVSGDLTGQIRLHLADGDTDNIVDKDGTSSLHFYGWQLQPTGFGHYVKTTTAAVASATLTDLEAWVTDGGGTTHGDVTTLFDLSSNSHHQNIQAGTARLVDGGTTNLDGEGNAYLACTNARFAASTGSFETYGWATWTVLQRTAGAGCGFFGHEHATVPYQTMWHGFGTGGNVNKTLAYVGDGTLYLVDLSAASTTDAGSVHSYCAISNSGGFATMIDGSIKSSAASVHAKVAANITPALGTTFKLLNGNWYECLFRETCPSLAELDTVHADHAAYYGSSVSPYIWSSKTAVKFAILLGQSNAHGRGDMASLDAEYAGEQANTFIWDGSDYSLLDSTLNNNQVGDTVTNEHAWEMSLGKEYIDANAGAVVYMYKYAKGGTLLEWDGATVSWDPAQKSADVLWYYAKAMADYLFALKAMQADNVQPGNFKIQWFQGGQDGLTEAHADAYEANLTAFIPIVEESLMVTSPLWDLIRISATGLPTYGATVRAADATVAAALARVTMIDTDSYTTEGGPHLDSTGQTDLGAALATTL